MAQFVILLATFAVNFFSAAIFFALLRLPFALLLPSEITGIPENSDLLSYLLPPEADPLWYIPPAAAVLLPCTLIYIPFVQKLYVRMNNGKDGSEEFCTMLRTIMRGMCKKSGVIDADSLHFYCCEKDASLNAWVIGKNHVTVTRGLLEHASRRELTGILAHELAHLVLGHTTNSLLCIGLTYFNRAVLWFFSWCFFLADIIGQIPLLGCLISLYTLFISLLYGIISFLFSLPMTLLHYFCSRQAEYDADEYAVRLGYGEALLEGLERIRESGHAKKLGFFSVVFSDHPDLIERIEIIKKMNETLRLENPSENLS